MTEETKSLVDTTAIDLDINSLASQVLVESDPEKTKQLIELFNWNISKKNTTRVLKLNNLYDDVTDQMVLRFKTRSDQFSNSDLLDYMKAVQSAIDTSQKNLTSMDTAPTIVHQTNTQINVQVENSFDRDARERILEAIQSTLSMAKGTINIAPDNVVEVATDAVKQLDSIVDNGKEN